MAIHAGEPSVLIVPMTSRPDSLISEKVSLKVLATQTVPERESTAMPEGVFPTWIVATTCLVASLISFTKLYDPPLTEPRQVTQTVPVCGSAAISSGGPPTLMVATTACLASLISDTVLS